MEGSLWERVDGSLWRSVKIPSNNEFLEQYHQWVYKKVSDQFRRDKDRVQDTVQNVRTRLLGKDFIGRWFFKHLTHELVDRAQAELILGRDSKLKFISVVQPVVGSRSEPDSLWRVRDLLDYAKFDHERYYYSIQNHTIDSDTVLRLLGYLDLAVPDPNGKTRDLQGNPVSFKPEAYNVLKSLYRQGRIKPAELTQHDCLEQVVKRKAFVNGKGERLCSHIGCSKKHWSRGYCTTHYGESVRAKCPVCEKGRASLHARGVSLADDWTKSPSAAASLRWDDSQLRDFLRNWRGQNLVSTVPTKIARPDGHAGPYQGIDAGLLKYASILITNEVINDFKRMCRTLDVSHMVFNDGVSPDSDAGDSVTWDQDDDGVKTQMVVKDSSAFEEFRARENTSDVITMISRADLTEEEQHVILEIDLKESNVREFAEGIGVSIAHVHRVRNSALEKMRNADVSDAFILEMMNSVCVKHGCDVEDLFGQIRVGPCVKARIKFFHNLSKLGLSVDEMAARTGMSRDRIDTVLGRATMDPTLLPE